LQIPVKSSANGGESLPLPFLYRILNRILIHSQIEEDPQSATVRAADL
jgi:hypothetical protein